VKAISAIIDDSTMNSESVTLCESSPSVSFPKVESVTKKNVPSKGKLTKTGRKVFDMPGQKKDPPSELSGSRIFYETLKTQIPESKMAEEYLLKFGLLPREEATRIWEELEKIKKKKGSNANVKKAKASKLKTTKRKARRARTRKRKSSKSKKKSKVKKKSKAEKKSGAKATLPMNFHLNFDFLLEESSEES